MQGSARQLGLIPPQTPAIHTWENEMTRGAHHTQNLRDLFIPQASSSKSELGGKLFKNNQAKGNFVKIIISGQFFPDLNADLNIKLISFS